MVLHTRERMDNTRRTVRREVEIIRTAARDVRERVDADQQTEPRGTSGRGGLLGRRGSLVKTPAVIVVDTIDNAVEHVQRFAAINRSVLR